MKPAGDLGWLDAEGRETLSALADVLIPPDESMPSASQARIAERYIDHVLASRPDLGSPLFAVLKGARGKDAREVANGLQKDEKALFDALSVAVAGAYFLNPEVRSLLGYSGQRAIPAEASITHMEELTAPVVRHGAGADADRE